MAYMKMDMRKELFKKLGLGEYNKESIRKFQAKYFTRQRDIDGVWGNDTDILGKHVYNVLFHSKNFTPQEFKCECGGKYCTGYPDYLKYKQVEHLQRIRDFYGKPMIVTCGLRCQRYNDSLVGSVKRSKHLTGKATDFYMRGVTDTLANRKNSIKVIKKMPNHNYTYGDGIDSSGNRRSAYYMGNAMHTEVK